MPHAALLTPAEAAETLAICVRQLRAFVSNGEIAAVRVGRGEKREALRFRPHDLRHTAASRIMRTTGSLKVAGEVLGHSSIKSTARYAHIQEADLRAAMEATNPVETVKIAKDSA